MTDKESEEYKTAKKNVEKKFGFYKHLTIYIIINILLILINLITSPQEIWFIYVTGFWGIGVICHFLSVFTLTSKKVENWKNKEIEKELKK
jgi:hypothetical protein